MASALGAMREGVLLLDGKGRIALANPAIRTTLRLAGDVAGKSLRRVLRNVPLRRLLDEAASADGPVSGELETGEAVPKRLLVHAVALRDDPGGMLAVFSDITDLRKLETVRRDFVANVSHELRTPVASVRAAAETLGQFTGTRPGVVADLVDIIGRNTDRLQQLIGDLLDLSRIESSGFRLVLEPVNPGLVARHVISIPRECAGTKGLRLSVDIPPGLPEVRVDRKALEQVLNNLVDNAVKYCTGGADVTIRARCAGTVLRVSVEDTGPGIEARHLPRLFERFYRVDTGRSSEFGSTGLGLSIVKHLVEAMQGTVSVESTPGRGSTFSFTLPVA